MTRRQLLVYGLLLFTAAALLWTIHDNYQLTPSIQSINRNINRNMTTKVQMQKSQKSGQLSSNLPMTPIVHQSWKTRQLPTDRSKRWSASWKTCFPNWEWRLWTDEDNLALVRDHYPWFLPVYLGYRKPVERADLARYFYMFHYGGIYADLDAVCIKNFAHLLQSAALVFGGMDDDNDDGVLHSLVQNSFMASRQPGHQFWMQLLKRIEKNFKAGKGGRPEDLTGPNVLMEVLREYVKSNATDVKIFPGKYFNPFSWKLNKNPTCKDFGRMSDADEKACIASFPEAYVVQVHTQSWDKGHMR